MCEEEVDKCEDRLEQAEVLLNEFNEAGDCRTEHLNDVMSMKACEFQDVTNDIRILIGNVAITQIPVNSNIATAGHKLQGMSKNTLIVNNLGVCCPVKGAYVQGAIPHEAHEQGLQRSTKATRLRGQNEAMQGATHPGQAFQGKCVGVVG